MVRLVCSNRHVRIDGVPEKALKRLDQVTSYLVQGHRYSKAFRTHRWDGREHLLVWRERTEVPGFYLPIGLLRETVGFLNDNGIEHELDMSGRGRLRLPIKYEWNPEFKLRPYQLEAVQAMTTGFLPGMGIVKSPPRSGKTLTAARIVAELQAPALFIVPDRWLLHQTWECLEKVLQVKVGRLGDSIWQVQDVTVATAGTLLSRRGGTRIRTVEGGRKIKVAVPQDPEYTRLRGRFDLVLFDEAHHLKGEEWHKVFMDFDAFYRVGLSATAFPDHDHEQGKGGIWLKACCGGVRVDISTSTLIEEGYLVRPTIELHEIKEPNLHGLDWDPDLLNLAVYQNEGRNEKIADIARDLVSRRRLKVLVVTNRKEQVRRLLPLLQRRGLRCHEVTGETATPDRKGKVRDFLDGTVDVLVGTVFGEGVDIPAIEAVINAEGGRDIKATIQRMRNLTTAEGKTQAVFVDFLDMTNPYLAAHSLERLRVYRSERAFIVKVV